jgi:bidirectional [NiFe] hydrogenase diaphorase subunit
MSAAASFSVTIDGAAVAAAAGQTILDAARAHGISIPTLCFLPGLCATNACRLCLVEVKGSGRLLPACHTAVQPGMEIVAHSARLDAYRRTVLELLLSERRHECSTCASTGYCELEDLAREFGIVQPSFTPLRFTLAADVSSPRFQLDQRRCILCRRCLQVCARVERAGTLDLAGRGTESRLILDLDRPWSEAASCTQCGKCAEVCPTGAILAADKPLATVYRRQLELAYLHSRK